MEEEKNHNQKKTNPLALLGGDDRKASKEACVVCLTC